MRGTLINVNSTLINIATIHEGKIVVRMAERSKAPDSRLITFPAYTGSGRSGLRMEAWVRIPLLTLPFFISFVYLFVLKSAKLQRDGSLATTEPPSPSPSPLPSPSPSPRVCTVGRTKDVSPYADIITKFSRLDGLPIFLTHGASLARFAR